MRRGRRGTTGGLLIRARMATWRWRTGGGASAPSGYCAGSNEEGRRGGEGVRCSTRVWVPFYRVRRGRGRSGMAGSGGN
jgi:hypothetical protein